MGPISADKLRYCLFPANRNPVRLEGLQLYGGRGSHNVCAVCGICAIL